MFVVGRLGNRLREPFRGTTAYDIMDAFGESPPLPCGEQPGQSVREPVFESGDDDASGRARHALHVPEDERRGDTVGFAGTPAGDDYRSIGPDKLRESLRRVEIDLILRFHLRTVRLLRDRLPRIRYLRCR